MGEGIFVIDIDEANRLLDEQRRVISEVARRCYFKDRNHHYCLGCPAMDTCNPDIIWEEVYHAG